MKVGADVEHVDGEMVAERCFDALVTLAHGRGFTADECRAPGAAQVAVIAHQLWLERFGGCDRIESLQHDVRQQFDREQQNLRDELRKVLRPDQQERFEQTFGRGRGRRGRR